MIFFEEYHKNLKFKNHDENGWKNKREPLSISLSVYVEPKWVIFLFKKKDK